MSALDILVALYFAVLRIDPADPRCMGSPPWWCLPLRVNRVDQPHRTHLYQHTTQLQHPITQRDHPSRGEGDNLCTHGPLPSTAASKASRHDARTHERLRPGVAVNETARG